MVCRGAPRLSDHEVCMVIVFPIALLLAQSPPPAATQPSEQTQTCLACHGAPDLAVTLPSGEVQRLYVDYDRFARSVHGPRLQCIDCHTDMLEVPHAAKPFKTSREFTIAYYEQCKRCHFANYTKTVDSVHYDSLARGDRTAPVCVDCHGAHTTTRAGQPRAQISKTCAKCHAGVSTVYGRSVHGKALLEDGNTDVPVCTDCHRSHDIAGPREQNWRMSTPGLCGNCHTDRALMTKYGLSIAVVDTYLDDFHGKTASLQRTERDVDRADFAAICTDCHGVHDITKTDDPKSSVMRANLTKTCQQCHAGATENFPAAWLSHYEPSWERAPLVYGIRWFYAIIIPFMMGGLILQILLHLWRVVVNR
jgi:predicted CXXCH cytochrome family protein